MKNLKILLLLLLLPFMNIGEMTAQTYTHDGGVKIRITPTAVSTDLLLSIDARGQVTKSAIPISSILGGLGASTLQEVTEEGNSTLDDIILADASGGTTVLKSGALDGFTTNYTFPSAFLGASYNIFTQYRNQFPNSGGVLPHEAFKANADGGTNTNRILLNHRFGEYGNTTGAAQTYAEWEIDDSGSNAPMDGGRAKIWINTALPITWNSDVGFVVPILVGSQPHVANTDMFLHVESMGTSLIYWYEMRDATYIASYTVATLPTGSEGDTAYVTDATAPTYLGTLTGGGAVVCPVFHNGTVWVSH